MIIIYNVAAIPVLLMIAGVSWGLMYLFPGLTHGSNFGLTIGAVTVGVGGVSSYFGLNGKIYFVPIWMLGLPFVCFGLGPIGSVAVVLAAAGGVFWWFQRTRKMEANHWNNARQEFLRTPKPSPGCSGKQFWQWARTTFHVPRWNRFTPEICDHDLKVLEAIQAASPALVQEEALTLSVFTQFLHQARAAKQPPRISVRLHEAVRNLLKNKVKWSRQDAPLVSVPSAPASPSPGRPHRRRRCQSRRKRFPASRSRCSPEHTISRPSLNLA